MTAMESPETTAATANDLSALQENIQRNGAQSYYYGERDSIHTLICEGIMV